MEQINSFEHALLNLVELQKNQLDELRNIRQAQQMNNQKLSYIGYTGRAQTSFSPYSLYSNQSISDAAAKGIYIPPSNLYGIPLSPYTQQSMSAFNQAAQSVNMKQLFTTPKSRVPRRQRDFMAQQVGHNVVNAGMAGVNVAASVAGDIAGSAMLGSAFGLGGAIVGGLTGGLILGAIANTTAEQLKVHQAYNNFLAQQSYRFIDRYESNNIRYGMGFSRSEMHEAASFLRHLNTEKFLKDSEIQDMLTGFTEAGLLRTVSDLESFKDKMFKLVDVVKSSALILNESYENVVQMMGELQRAGINAENFDYMASKFKVIGSFSGQSATTIAGQVLNMATNNTQWTTLDPVTAMNNASLSLRIATELERESRNNPKMQDISNLFANAPGQDMAEKIAYFAQRVGQLKTSIAQSSVVNDMMAAFFKPTSDGSFELDQETLRNAIANNITDQELAKLATQRLNSLSTEQLLAWENRNNVIFQETNELDQNKIISVILGAIQRGRGLSDTNAVFDLLGINLSSEDRQALLSYFNMSTTRGSQLQSELDMLSINTQLQAQLDANAKGVGARIANWGEKVKDTLGDLVAPISDWASDLAVKVSDWWTGRNSLLRYNYNNVYDFGQGQWVQSYDQMTRDIKGNLETLFGDSEVSSYFAKVSGESIDENLRYTLSDMLPHDVLQNVIEGSDKDLESLFAGSGNTKEAIMNNFFKLKNILSDPASIKRLTKYDIVALNRLLNKQADYLSRHGVDVDKTGLETLGYTPEMIEEYNEYKKFQNRFLITGITGSPSLAYSAMHSIRLGDSDYGLSYYKSLLSDKNNVSIASDNTKSLNDILEMVQEEMASNESKALDARFKAGEFLSKQKDAAFASQVNDLFAQISNGSMTKEKALERLDQIGKEFNNTSGVRGIRGYLEAYADAIKKQQAGQSVISSIDTQKDMLSNIAKGAATIEAIFGIDITDMTFETREKDWWQPKVAFKKLLGIGADEQDWRYKTISLGDLGDAEKVGWLTPETLSKSIKQIETEIVKTLREMSVEDINAALDKVGIAKTLGNWAGDDNKATENELKNLAAALLKFIQEGGLKQQEEDAKVEADTSARSAAQAAEDHKTAMNEFLDAFKEESDNLRSMVQMMRARMPMYGYYFR